MNPGTEVFCATPYQAATSAVYRRGPFLLYANSSIPPAGHASELDRLPRQPIYRCRTPQGHMLAVTANCDGRGQVESVLGYAAASPSTAMPRTLRRCCLHGMGPCYHTTDAPCADADAEETLLAFVL